MDEKRLVRAAEVLLRYDYSANRSSSHRWEDLTAESQEIYLLRARQVVQAYGVDGDGG